MTRHDKMEFYLVVQSFCFIFLRICQKSRRAELEMMETQTVAPQMVEVLAQMKVNVTYFEIYCLKQVR